MKITNYTPMNSQANHIITYCWVCAREYIIIIDLDGIGITNDEARLLTQRLTSQMINIGVYQVLERSKMESKFHI